MEAGTVSFSTAGGVYIGYLVMTEQELPEELQKGKEFIEEIADKDEKVKDK